MNTRALWFLMLVIFGGPVGWGLALALAIGAGCRDLWRIYRATAAEPQPVTAQRTEHRYTGRSAWVVRHHHHH